MARLKLPTWTEAELSAMEIEPLRERELHARRQATEHMQQASHYQRLAARMRKHLHRRAHNEEKTR